MFSPTEITENYITIGAKKAKTPILKLLMLGVFSGFIIGMGSVVTNTASFQLQNVSAIKIASGLLFPFGLGIIMLLGTELFTGNAMIIISVLEKKATVKGMLTNWIAVYFGNLIGAVLLAIGCAYFGQLNFGNGELAVYTIKVATAKTSLSFGSGVVLGIFCNVLVCTGVLTSLSAKDTSGKILGAFIPVAFFVIAGFEHSVANMYYIPAGIFANSIESYKNLASSIDTSSLTWSNFVFKNLVPVTLGNIIGGFSVALMMWATYVYKPKIK